MSKEIKFTRPTEAEKLTVEYWLVNEGEAVKEGQELLTIKANDKVFIIRAPIEGILLKRDFKNGETLDKDQSLGEIVTAQEAAGIRIDKQLTEKNFRTIQSLRNGPSSRVKRSVHVKATPNARQVANRENVNLEEVEGTGPEGRIQVQDIYDFIEREKNKEKKESLKKKERKVQYGLPLTALALRLAKRNKLDVSKIPAPPDASKIKKRDVERYLRNPQGAEDEIEYAYNIYNLAKLNIPEIAYDNILRGSTLDRNILIEPKEEQSVIKLSTEEPNVMPRGNEAIELEHIFTKVPEMLDHPFVLLLDEPPVNDGSVIKLFTEDPLELSKDDVIELAQIFTEPILQLGDPTPELFLDAPDLIPHVIRLTTDVPSDSSDHSVINLEDHSIPVERFNKPIEIFLLEEPDEKNYVSEPIRLPSEEIPTIPSGQVIIIVPDEMTPDFSFDQYESSFGAIEPATLSTLVDLNLIDLIKKYNPPQEEIGNFAKNYILSTVLKTFKEITDSRISNAVYISDLIDDTYATFSSTSPIKAGKELSMRYKSKRPIKLDDGDIIIVDLIPFNIDSVEGLVSTKDHIVVYISYLKQLERFFNQKVISKSVLKVTLNFDKNKLSVKEGLLAIDQLRTDLEKLEVENEQ